MRALLAFKAQGATIFEYGNNLRGHAKEAGVATVLVGQVTKDVAESIGLGKPTGALVRGAESGGPADKAGVEAGDIITKVDGKLIEKSGDLPRIVGATKPGSKTVLQVFRRGAYKDLSITVAELDAAQQP